VYALDGQTLTPFDDLVSFGELLRTKRLERDLTQAELAALLGVQQQAVGRWEKDKDLPRQETVRRLVKHLGISGSQVAVALGYIDEEDAAPVPLPRVAANLTVAQRLALDALLDAFLRDSDRQKLDEEARAAMAAHLQAEAAERAQSPNRTR
jgi:transcriptional regulator with XRE-family HTH domain